MVCQFKCECARPLLQAINCSQVTNSLLATLKPCSQPGELFYYSISVKTLVVFVCVFGYFFWQFGQCLLGKDVLPEQLIDTNSSPPDPPPGILQRKAHLSKGDGGRARGWNSTSPS